MTDSQLAEAVARLPQRYQPIYGFDDQGAERAADLPRTEAILSTFDLVGRTLGRPLRILDLGSAQGYYAFRAAERGHHVTGVEDLPANLEVARLIAELHPELDVEFVAADVAAIAAGVTADDFDLVLGLSILHHLADRDGHDSVVALAEHLQAKIPFGVFEMALRDEPLYWADGLPPDPRETLAPYRFIRELAWSPTHLSDLTRPVMFCSSTHALVAGELQPIVRYSESSHARAAALQAGLRRYIEFDHSVVKIAACFGSSSQSELLVTMRDELRHERAVLEELDATGIDAPRLIEYAESPTEVLLARSSYPGDIVSELLPVSPEAREAIFEQVLEELAELEAHGWYHTDLRTWNVVWNESGSRARLIDHGALQHEPTDLAWPNSAYYSFVLFADALWSGEPEQLGLDAPRALSRLPNDFPSRIGSVLHDALLRAPGPSFFAEVLADWRASSDDVPPAPLALDVGCALAQVVHADYGERKASLIAETRANRQHLAERDALIDQRAQLWAERDTLYANLDELRTMVTSLLAERDDLYAQRDELYAQRQSLYDERQALTEERQALYDERVALYEQLARLSNGR